MKRECVKKAAVAALEDCSDNSRQAVRRLLDYTAAEKLDTVVLLQGPGWTFNETEAFLGICRDYPGLAVRFAFEHGFCMTLSYNDWMELRERFAPVALANRDVDLNPCGIPFVTWYQESFAWTENSEWVLSQHEAMGEDDAWWIYRNGRDEMILGSGFHDDCRIHMSDYTDSPFVSTLYCVTEDAMQVSLLTQNAKVIPVGELKLPGR